MNRLLTVLYISIFLATGLFADEYTDAMLDRAIEEFSKEKYDDALAIIDEVLTIEPDNVTAQMYKKTIEDVSTIEKIEEIEQSSSANATDVSSSEMSDESEIEDMSHSDFMAINNYLAGGLDSTFYGETRLRFSLGAAVSELAIRSNTIYYDVNDIGSEIFPFDSINLIDKHMLDFSFGGRYSPSSVLGSNPGFIDFKIGAKNFYNYNGVLIEDITIPYLSFDSEIHLLKVFGENIIFNNLWFGIKGTQYIYNTEITNNYTIEFKSGIRLGHFNFGGFYSYSKIDSVDYDLGSGGIILGIVF